MTNFIKMRKTKQVMSLYSSTFLWIIIGIAVSVLNTRILGPQHYGDLKFLHALFNIGGSIFIFGFFDSGARLIAQQKNVLYRQELIAASIVLAAIISMLVGISIYIFSYFEAKVFNNNLGHIIRLFSPLLFVYPFKLCIEKILQGDNRIYELSAFRLFPSMFYLFFAFIFNYFFSLKLPSALLIQMMTLGVAIVILIFLLKPEFRNIKRTLLAYWNENKKYGIHVYIGFLAGVISANLAEISIAYHLDNTNVGIFSLALYVTLPLSMIPSIIGTTFYKEFANRDSIPKSATIASLVLSILALSIFMLLIEKVVLFLYSEQYSAVIPLSYYLAVASILMGFGNFFNRFLGAHGKGKQMRNGAFATGLLNVIGYIFLVKWFGVKGAAVTKILSASVYLLMMIFYCKETIKVLRDVESRKKTHLRHALNPSDS